MEERRSDAKKRSKLEQDVRRTGARLRETIANIEEVAVLLLQGDKARAAGLAEEGTYDNRYHEFVAAVDRASGELHQGRTRPPPPPRKRRR